MSKGFIPIIFIIVGVVVIATVTFGIIRYKEVTSTPNITREQEITTRKETGVVNQEVAIQEQSVKKGSKQTNTTYQKCASDMFICNDTCWQKCSTGFDFYCSPTRGMCCEKDAIYCNNDCYRKCDAGQKLYCPSNGEAPQCKTINGQCLSDTISCNNKCWTKCTDGKEFLCSSDGKNAYCIIPNQENQNTKAIEQENTTTNTNSPIIAMLSELTDYVIGYNKKADEYLEQLKQNETQKEQEYQEALKPYEARVAEIKNDPFFIECSKALCWRGTNAIKFDAMNKELTQIYNAELDLLHLYYPETRNYSKYNFKYPSYTYQYYIMSPNGLGGFTISNNSGENYIMSSDGLGGYNLDVGETRYRISPNGLGGYNISNF